ncbi:MAG: hypothetical protein P1U38_09635 [Aeromicrobium sp.]|uniref:hypothetical protein n=1 Tax=Aeromicrobium sp. TaxID=1871063 RepID=UPI002633911C|nr:hypothetical protein [Aeromicrobium sp.]MDF1705022.1 hypothetical protein [Aeromicrobium sp.]
MPEATATDAGAVDIVAALDATDPANQATAPAATEPAETAQEPSSETTTEPGEEALGDAGKQALDRMKAKWQGERDKRIAAEAKINDGTPADDPERLQREADAKALAKANDRIVRAEIRAAAAGKLSDPADALNFIDLTQFEVDDDGSLDESEVADAIKELLEKKPYLAAQGGPKTPKPDPSQGEAGRGTASTADRFAASLDGIL